MVPFNCDKAQGTKMAPLKYTIQWTEKCAVPSVEARRMFGFLLCVMHHKFRVGVYAWWCIM